MLGIYACNSVSAPFLKTKKISLGMMKYTTEKNEEVLNFYPIHGFLAL